jgi:hypothetical protein
MESVLDRCSHAIGRATGMPLSDAPKTGANALMQRVAAGRRASETTQCARHHSAARTRYRTGIGTLPEPVFSGRARPDQTLKTAPSSAGA